LFCGEGGYDLRGFIASVRKTGYDGPWAVEVFSEELTKMTVDELSQRAFETTMAVFQ
jgi:sugar phosphate isomerase/epimerase